MSLHHATESPGNFPSLQVGASASLLKTRLIGLVLSWKMHEKKMNCYAVFWIKSRFHSKQGLFGLLLVVVSAPGILLTYQSPSKPLCLIANLPYYVLKCTLIFYF